MVHMPPLFAFLGTPEIIMILLIVLLFFGARRLPEMARGMGKAVAEFRKASHAAEEEIRTAIEREPPPPPGPAAPAATPRAPENPGTT